MCLAKAKEMAKRDGKETALARAEQSDYSWFYPHTCEVKFSCFQDVGGRL